MQFRDLHNTEKGWMFKMKVCQWACKKGDIALIWSATTRKKLPLQEK